MKITLKITAVVALVAVLAFPALLCADDNGADGGKTPGESSKRVYARPPAKDFSAEAPPIKDRVGVQANVSPLGYGAQAALALTRHSNLRGGFNLMNYTRTFSKNGINYDSKLSWRSVSVLYDYFAWRSFHVSGGALLYDGNKLTATGTAPSNQSFSISGASYISNPADPIRASGHVAFNKVAPMLLVGFGNLVPRSHKHLTATFDIGVAFQGTPTTQLSFAGSACSVPGTGCVNAASDPVFLANVKKAEDSVTKAFSPLRFLPIVSFGIGYKF